MGGVNSPGLARVCAGPDRLGGLPEPLPRPNRFDLRGASGAPRAWEIYRFIHPVLQALLVLESVSVPGKVSSIPLLGDLHRRRAGCPEDRRRQPSSIPGGAGYG